MPGDTLGNLVLNTVVAPGTPGAQAQWTDITTLVNGDSGLSGVNLIDVSAETVVQYGTINEAVSAAEAGDAIIIGAGSYTEPPMTLTGISVGSLSGPDSVHISPSTPTSPLFTMGTESSLFGVLIKDVDGVGGKGIYFPVGTNESYVSNIHIRDCTLGVDVDATGKDSWVREIIYESGAGSYFMRVNNGAHMQLYDSQLMGAVTLTANVLVDGGTLHMYTGHYDGDNTADGILLKNDGVVYAHDCHFHSFTNGANVEASGGMLYLLGCDFLANATWDVLAAAGSSTHLFFGGSVGDKQKLSLGVGVVAHGTFIVRTAGDEGTQLFGECSIGTVPQPGELTVGEGDSYTNGMVVMSHDGGSPGTWVDNSVAAASATASTFSLLQGLAADNAGYWMHPTNRFNGLKALGGGTAADLTGGSFIWEYSTGVDTWAPFNVMTTDAASPYAQKAQTVFEITSTADQIRFDMTELTAGNWVSVTLNGQTGLAVRVRTATGPITTVPILQQTKLSSNRAEFNGDGVYEQFGEASTLSRKVYWEATGELLSEPSGGANGPTNLDVSVSANISYRQVDSQYPSGSDVRRSGTMISVPEGLNTAMPGLLRLVVLTDGTDVDPVFFDLFGAQVKIGDTLGALTEQALTDHTTVPPGVANEVYTVEFEIDISTLTPGDFFAYTLWRLGSTDANTDSAGILTMQFLGYPWRP